jgi:hypothetical protein
MLRASKFGLWLIFSMSGLCYLLIQAEPDFDRFLQILQSTPIEKHDEGVNNRLLFVAGLEGSGHHAFGEIMSVCDNTGCSYESELTWLSIGYTKVENKTIGLFSGTEGTHNQMNIEKMMRRMHTIASSYAKKLTYIGLKDARHGGKLLMMCNYM